MRKGKALFILLRALFLCRDNRLLPTFTSLFNAPFQFGVPYDRWKNNFDVIAFKNPDDRHVHRLSSFALGEADWNMGGRIIVNRKMMLNAERTNTMPSEHFWAAKDTKQRMLFFPNNLC